MKMAKRILSIMLSILTLVSVVSVSAEALKVVVEDDEKYGYMVPVNNKGTKVVSTVKLYGDYDYINFYINARYNFTTYFFYEIYSDKKLKKCVYSNCIEIEDEGTYNISEKIKLKGKFKSKTYYVVSYTGRYFEDSDKLVVDSNSMCRFEMVVDRSPSYDEKKVMLKNVSNTVDGPKISWSKISGTSKYYIYRRKIGSSKMKRIGSVSGKKSSFTDTSVKKKDGNYIYTVKGIGKKGAVSRYHYQGLACLYAEAPPINSVSVVADNTIQIKWRDSDPKARFYIYRKEKDGKWKTLAKNIADNFYNDTTAKNGKEYTYRVKSVISTNYGKATSAYYVAEKKKVRFLEAPVMNELEIAENAISLSWSSVEGATGYSVLRKPLDSDEKWTVLKKVTDDITSYVDTKVSLTDGAYLYSVRSEGKNFSGSYSSGKEYFTLTEPEFNVSVDADGVHIKWSKVPYATSYRILEQQDDGLWNIKNKTRKTSYEFEPSTYYSKKISVCAVRSGIESSYKTDVEDVRYFPQITPEFTELENYTKIKWNSTFADSYRLYRKLKDAPDTDYELFYENRGCSFSNGSPENDVAYTYQIRGVYGDVEQYNNMVSKTHTRYSPETCIKNFKAYKEIEVFNRRYKSNDKETTSYRFDVDKTEAFKKSTVKFYYWGDAYAGEGWAQTSGYSYVEDYEAAYDLVKPARFCCVVSTNSGNSTPLGANTIYVEEETCKAPEITITPTSKGFKLSWNAVENAEEYEVFVGFREKDNYKKTIDADSSKSYSLSFTDVDDEYNIYLWVSAVHKNGNKTTRRIDSYNIYNKPKLIKAGVKKDNIEVIWDDGYNDSMQYAVLRKAEGESEWTVLSKKYYESKWCTTIDGKEYTGFVYTDKKTKKGVKYTYTVRLYDPEIKEYVSYYNTKGVSAKR